jgi:hypothetical protein
MGPRSIASRCLSNQFPNSLLPLVLNKTIRVLESRQLCATIPASFEAAAVFGLPPPIGEGWGEGLYGGPSLLTPLLVGEGK